MSADGFQINPDDIRSSVPVFTGEADRLRAAVSAFRAELAGLGAPWGGDENGREFAATFVPNQGAIVRGADVLVQGLASIGPTLTQLADNTVNADEANARSLS